MLLSLYEENLIIQPLRLTGIHDLDLEANSKNRFEGTGLLIVFFCISLCMQYENLTLLELELVFFR